MRRRVTSRRRQTTIGVSGNAAVGYYHDVTFFLWILVILQVTAAAAVPSPFVVWTTLLVDGGGVPATTQTATTASFVFQHTTTGHHHHNKHTHNAVVCQARFGTAYCRSNTAMRMMGVAPLCYSYDDPHGRRREERRRSVVLQDHHNDEVDNDDGENDEIEIIQQPPYYYLSVAATHLKEASMALLLLDDNDDRNDLLDASKDLERASIAWQDEEEGGWEEVAMELGSCSTSLVQRQSNTNNNQKYARASEALWEASQIGGCLSVGPMASASFMEDFAAELESLSTAAANKNCPSAKHFQAAASAIQAYVHSCIG
uniref:Uncharacterized protein n=1 Tax=Attheya septentrionalis TaxID=420275 RepID=A0A7S2UFA8_9STRA